MFLLNHHSRTQLSSARQKQAIEHFLITTNSNALLRIVFLLARCECINQRLRTSCFLSDVNKNTIWTLWYVPCLKINALIYYYMEKNSSLNYYLRPNSNYDRFTVPQKLITTSRTHEHKKRQCVNNFKTPALFRADGNIYEWRLDRGGKIRGENK